MPKSGVSLSCNTGGVTLLPVASVLVASPSGPVEANVIFDGGADRSFISKSLMKRVEGRYEGSVELTCASFGGAKMIDVCDCYEICVSAISPSLPTVERIEVVEVETISAPLRRPPVPDDLLRPFDHLQLASPVNRTSSDSVLHIDLVIGQDQYWNLVRSGLVRSSEGLVAMETAFGWVLSGSAGGQSCGAASACQLLIMVTPHTCDVWSEEDPYESGESDGSLLTAFNDDIELQQGRYVVRIPWNENKDQLMDNFRDAEKRLIGLENKLQKNPPLQAAYSAALSEMESDGVISEVSPDQLVTDNVTFYLPHRPVVKLSSSSTKVRPVFDGTSARGPNGVSLNDVVHVGPALMPSVQEVLLRFRRWKYGVSGDIKRAFHQISLCEADRDAHRFLWRQEGRLRVMRFERVTMGVACSPFLMNATIKYHLAQYADCRVKTELMECLYADDGCLEQTLRRRRLLCCRRPAR